MDILITYDISEGNPDRHNEVKQELIKKEYHTAYNRDDISYDLPNTTLWKQDKIGTLTTQTGLNDLNDAVNIINRKYTSSKSMVIRKAECVAFVIHSGIPRK